MLALVASIHVLNAAPSEGRRHGRDKPDHDDEDSLHASPALASNKKKAPAEAGA
jgi:hypothetical protein